MKYLTQEVAMTLPTPRLLAFYKKLRKTQWAVEDYVWTCTCEDCKAINRDVQAWMAQMELIKGILDTREHVK